MSDERRHDLDALRAAAMLLGIAYHAALSFAAGMPWFVQDTRQTVGLYYFESASHGFRMPLFFLISGIFTAMLWQKRGLRGLWANRLTRILLPCLLGLVTIVPLTNWSVGLAIRNQMQRATTQRDSAAAAIPSIWRAVAQGNVPQLQAELAAGLDTATLHPQFGTTLLAWSALHGQVATTEALLAAGADADQPNRDGSTALHGACFLGRDAIVPVLLAAGADWQARDAQGNPPLTATWADWGTTLWLANVLGIPIDPAAVQAGRQRIQQQWGPANTTEELNNTTPANRANGPSPWWQLIQALTQLPLFAHLWFLWFLIWLGLGFTLGVGLWSSSQWLVPASVRSLAWGRLSLSPWVGGGMILLTCWPQSQMGLTNVGFGPDTSIGLLPMPHVLLYYALFFGFGVWYFASQDRAGRLGAGWRWTLPLTVLLGYPLALEFSTGHLGWGRAWVPEGYHRALGVALQAWFAWQMSWGCMGMFRSLVRQGQPWVRYLSDSSYWLYLAHMPLVVLGQLWLQDVPLPAVVKWLGLTVGVTGVLLIVYQVAVRHTWLGRLLNGPRR